MAWMKILAFYLTFFSKVNFNGSELLQTKIQYNHVQYGKYLI